MAVDHYENFPVASVLLPRRFREPVSAIYAFARAADDLADEGDLPDAQRLAGLDEFAQQLQRIELDAPPTLASFARLAAVIRTHHLPIGLFHDLLDAFRQDVTRKRYAQFGEVVEYCRRSANPIGRLLLHLYRETSARNLACSDQICSSLQLINFLQDVAIDWRKGRVYLPQEEMQRFGIEENQIARGDAGGAWPAFMRWQIERTRTMLRAGAPLGRALQGRLGMELRMIVQGGERILEKLQAVDGDVFSQRPALRATDWLRMFVRALRAA